MSTTTTLLPHRSQATPDLDHDRRSSSLSELGENIENDEIDTMDLIKDNDPEANDTEAETERLENTPLTQWKHRDVLVTSDDRITTTRDSPSPTNVNGKAFVEQD